MDRYKDEGISTLKYWVAPVMQEKHILWQECGLLVLT